MLTNITDVAGFSSSFSYDAHVWMTRMVTPYGTNSFKITGTDSPNVLNGRAIEITEPDGNKQLYVYRDGLTNVYSEAYPAREVPSTANANFSFGNSFDNSAMYDRNSFYWGRLQYELLSTNYLHSGDIYQLTAADYLVSRLRHWLKHQDGSQRAGRTLSLERLPSPNAITEGQKTWYDYDWKSSTDTEGTEIMPSLIARVLPDGTTQFRRYLRNNWGLVTEGNSTYSKEDGTIDVRTTTYQYATNDIDIIAVTNPLGIRVSSNYFNAHHQLLTNYNALDEMTVWHYNERQQVVGIEYPSGLVTTNYYDNRGQLALTIDFAILETNTIYYRTNSYRYANNLIYTHTDERGLTTTNYWDKLQRLTAEIDSRGTNRYFYDKLDLVKIVDRLGHTTSFGYNSVRQQIAETNALGTVTGYSYCLCGSPDSVTNAVGTALEQTTQSNHDYEGRPTFVLYPDNSSFTYYYDPLGRVTNVLDAARHGVTNYFNNQRLLVVTSNYYGRSTAVTYDVLDRPRSVVDANGVTIINTYDKLGRPLSRSCPDAGEENFGYLPNVAGLTSYKNQLGVHVVQYAYDPLGRKVQEVFPGIATNSYAYDGAGSLTSLTDGSHRFWNNRTSA